VRLSVASLLESPESDTTVDFAERVEFPADLGRLTRPLAGLVTISRSMDDRLLRLTGHLSAGVELECVRCLGPAPTDVSFDLDETLEITDEPETAAEVSEHVQPTGELDLSDLLRQNLLLNLPSRSLCGCEPEYLAEHRPIDPRWRTLEHLLHSPPSKEP